MPSTIPGNVLQIKALQFARAGVEYSSKLTSLKQFALAHQFIRCSTSIGATIFEATKSESRKDFIHKLKIAEKEASETAFWLLLFSQFSEFPPTTELDSQLTEIKKLLGKSISTAKRNMENLNT